MTRLWVGIIAFVGGVLVGAELAKLYATNTITSDVNAGLGKIGLGGGAVQNFVDNTIIPAAVN